MMEKINIFLYIVLVALIATVYSMRTSAALVVLEAPPSAMSSISKFDFDDFSVKTSEIRVEKSLKKVVNKLKR